MTANGKTEYPRDLYQACRILPLSGIVDAISERQKDSKRAIKSILKNVEQENHRTAPTYTRIHLW